MADEIRLRAVTGSDLDVLFEQGRDPTAVRMAAFTSRDPGDRRSFDAHWTKLLADPTVVLRTIESDCGTVLGSIASFVLEGEREIAFWIGREHWGRGAATKAVASFLREVPTRPLFARAAKDNAGSRRVLAKCGFVEIGEGRWFANARGAEIEEVLFRLD
jgi:RimJ/RimL family protein N-acetyltransferase